MRRRHGSFGRQHSGRWMRWLALAFLVALLLVLLYGCMMQRLVYSAHGTLLFLPDRPFL